MLAAVKCKQNVDPALADALDGAVADMSKMQLVLHSHRLMFVVGIPALFGWSGGS